MRICFSSGHRYPGRLHGPASTAVHDNLVLGLAQLGHEVTYRLPREPEVPLPEGVTFSSGIRYDVDILHLSGAPDPQPWPPALPWVKTIHCDIGQLDAVLGPPQKNWIYVSRSQARRYASERFVHNGINPAEFIYSETKAGYLVFLVGGAARAFDKGLDIALRVAQKSGMELRVGATNIDPAELEAFEKQCLRLGAVPVGAVYGREKAELLAGAEALLFPSRLNETFGLVIAEALISGTPVIASAMGAIPEVLDLATGFVCEQEADYLRAIANRRTIKPSECRKVAMERYHYLKMAESYLREYEREIAVSEHRVMARPRVGQERGL